MKEKGSYTLEELCNGLSITLTKFCQMAGITEGTLIRLRQGHAGRRNTINSILATFGQVYGLEFSLENVTGLKPIEKPITPIAEKATSPPVSSQPAAISQPASPQIRDVEPKRTYKPRKTDLPGGCILTAEFAKRHGVNERTFKDHVLIGLGEGTIWGQQTDPVLPVRDHVEESVRPHPSRSKEKQHYLTSDQQHAALEFWKRHDVAFTECDQSGCYCHTKGE